MRVEGCNTTINRLYNLCSPHLAISLVGQLDWDKVLPRSVLHSDCDIQWSQP